MAQAVLDCLAQRLLVDAQIVKAAGGGHLPLMDLRFFDHGHLRGPISDRAFVP
jgi:hypothetical protein